MSDYIWSTSEKSRLRASALYRIRCIVQEYGGKILNIDLDNYLLDIQVPEEHRDECAMRVQAEIDHMESL